jgi:hypothetical protein
VTRRFGWWNLKPGDVLCAIEKGQGLKKGEHVKRICLIEVVSVRKEKLQDITEEDVAKEGIDTEGCCLCPPEKAIGVRFCINCNERLHDLIGEFEELWTQAFGSRGPKSWGSNPIVNRIEFKYL